MQTADDEREPTVNNIRFPRCKRLEAGLARSGTMAALAGLLNLARFTHQISMKFSFQFIFWGNWS